MMKAKAQTVCPLCLGGGELLWEKHDKEYHRCGHCSAVFLDPSCYVSREDEEKRYREHNNNVHDLRYQKFVEPVVLGVEQRFSLEQIGLDFGAGTGPVISKLLCDKGYSVELYDPFFYNDPEKLKKRYDFIVCCEVMEHFHSPAKEFRLLRSLLKPQGVLFCMTNLYSEGIDFKTWYYKNDPTHVFFYHQITLEWIKSRFGFSAMKADGRLVQFLS